MRRLDPASVMPTFLMAGDGARQAAAWRGRPILSAAEIEDLVALLAAQKE
jgi:sulfur-oxidizing protein SoxX